MSAKFRPCFLFLQRTYDRALEIYSGIDPPPEVKLGSTFFRDFRERCATPVRQNVNLAGILGTGFSVSR
ncbi:hypothetical protein NicSoilB11_42300 (plasmid) [Arthrobacter sp. NicSoilB11]|nr:hypothetical protein NicSoilB11_42300 [Arthrobacter sp. NicSoilB11]